MVDIPSSAEQSPGASKINALTPKPNYVYLIATCDQGAARSYVGWTTDLEKRLAAHNAGAGAKSTRGRQWREPRAAVARLYLHARRR
ncbi:MAG: GIY-YIG nuclease family protein, partial [Pseudomonadota bacterium]|nr:GIY-YIG nuclease family protein [Pseudomonadota bacterium]